MAAQRVLLCCGKDTALKDSWAGREGKPFFWEKICGYAVKDVEGVSDAKKAIL
jgi:hypothetical protein